MALTLITAAAVQPVTRADVIAQLKLDDEPDDGGYIDGLIAAAIAHMDGDGGVLKKALMEQTWEQTFSTFPLLTERLILDLPPLNSVVSIKYYDLNDTLQTLDPALYYVQDKMQPARKGRVQLKQNATWPATILRDDAVTVRFLAGWPAALWAGEASALGTPVGGLKRLIVLQVALWHENRVPLAEPTWMLDDLLSFYSVKGF